MKRLSTTATALPPQILPPVGKAWEEVAAAPLMLCASASRCDSRRCPARCCGNAAIHPYRFLATEGGLISYGRFERSLSEKAGNQTGRVSWARSKKGDALFNFIQTRFG